MTDISDIRPGQVITISDGRRAIIRFVGSTEFAQGEWVGLELEDATGKNDGSVKGERYFDCEMGYGMFIRPSAITEIVEQPRREERPNGNPVNGTAVRGRPSSGVPGITGGAIKRQSFLGSTATAKRMSINAGSPTPGSRGMAPGLRGTRVWQFP
jgi:dynactin 1